MKALRALLADRRRSQRGSVLSAVLIMTAFLAVISGALMTELSTNFLLTNHLVNRVATEATVNSAMELALDKLQHASLGQGCPSLPQANLTNGTAVANYVSCALVVDSRSTQFRRTPVSFPLTVDGTHTVLPAQGRNDYLVGDASGNVFDYSFDQMRLLWTKPLGGSVTGPPQEVPDQNNQPQGIVNLVPVSNPNPGASPGCGPANFCVAAIGGGRGDGDADDQTLDCFMAAGAAVTARPAAGTGNNDDLAYFGDGAGNLYAYDTDEGACALEDSALIAGGPAVVAGPLVFSGSGGTDHLYLLVSDGASSSLVHYTYKSSQGLRFASSLPLPAPQAIGMALEPGNLPSRLAVAGAGGQVALAQIQSGFGVSLLASTSVPTSIAGAPYWCQCPGGDLIGVAGGNGGLYVLDTSLSTNATFPSGGPAISTSPTADAGGDWFFGAGDGNVYEVQSQAGQATLALIARYGSGAGPLSSSPLLGGCNTTWICVYAGSSDALYIVPLDARRAVVTACMSTAPPACSGSNPQLWATVEVGSASSLNTVHVRGWSYYSP